MKKDVRIVIDDNLSEQEELLEIAKRLRQKSLSSSGISKQHKRIGNQVDVKSLETTITIVRKSKEKPIEFVTCNLCGCEYQSDLGKVYYHNYGGKRNKKKVCSDNCLNNILDALGNRASKSASKLPSPINFFKR